MTAHRTCSYVESLVVVSWCVTRAAAEHVLTDVEVVAESFLGRDRVVAFVTVRLFDCDALAQIFVDGRYVASHVLSQSAPDAKDVPGSLFRRLVPLSPELLDGRTHRLSVVVDRPRDGRAMIASHETEFYARRASNRRLMSAPPASDSANCVSTARAPGEQPRGRP